MRRLILQIGLTALSTTASLLVCEAVARQIVNPVNFLRPEVLADPVLEIRVKPGSGGHDTWGFRNERVPESARIVAIGDSMTYGNQAAADQSWPAWLGRLSGRSVYNLGHGGYGPLQYLHLLRERAFGLEPETVVVAVFPGNDLFDAYRLAYHFERWASKRDPAWLAEFGERYGLGSEIVDGVSPAERERQQRITRAHPGWRGWLGRHSVVYRWLALTLGDFAAPGALRANAAAIPIEDARGALRTALDSRNVRVFLDFEDPRVREGLRVTREALGEIATACRERGVGLVVVLIPAKSRVFEHELGGAASEAQRSAVAAVAAGDRRAASALRAHLGELGVPTVEVVDELQRRLRAHPDAPLYGRSADGHPIGSGYRVVAERVWERLQAVSP